jgi:thiamine biosynthesis lipoprotein
MMDWPTYQFRAMGSHIQLWLDADPLHARPAFERVEAWFEKTEDQLSRFRPHSELCRLNDRPQEWVPVSPLMWRIVTTALSLAQATGGLFDPTILPALEAAGYTASFDEMHGAGTAPAGALPAPGRWPQVQVDPVWRAICLPAGVRLDLGGVAKGLVAQEAARMLSEGGPALVDAGGDLTAAQAPRGWPGWPVAVAAPAAVGEDEGDLFQLLLADGTLATSGSDYRRWQQGTQTAHHVIDPRTGSPATSDVVTATVLARDAAQAEGWATAALVAGSDVAMDMLEERKVAAALVCSDGRVRRTNAMEAIAI